MLPLGLIAIGVVFVSARRRGRNEVFAGGAADAAYGSLPLPTGDAPPRADVRMVPDSKMDELATIEFVPPKGIEPWQGAVLLNETIRSHHRCGVGLGPGRQGRDHVDGR